MLNLEFHELSCLRSSAFFRARFCNKCGTLVSQVPNDEVTVPVYSVDEVKAASASVPSSASDIAMVDCPECGKAVKPGVRFCTGCGSAIPVPGPASTATATGFADTEPGVLPPLSNTVSEVDLSLGFDDDRPPVIERSVIDSLPLHPVQRGMPDFELPEPRQLPERAARPAKNHVPRTSEPVSFEALDAFDETAGQASGSNLKWLAVAALAVLVVGGAGWYGYQQFGNDSSRIVATPAADAQPAQDGVADGEAVVPAANTGAADTATQAIETAPPSATAAENGAALVPTAVVAPEVVSAQTAAPEAAASDQPVPVTVPPVRVLQDSAGMSSGGVNASARERQRNKSLNSLLD
ncbi:zinc ribbon domain-containing protein [Diaphorobacter aerolatus]|uniref:Zinc ribbon domain-containing protein n=1 Tax=Diaphorobacter aerolatus TaxID=1288495 RepID=A0A7H0GKB5_9BURK|nr:zinc ribbon domain-containing protein [Diaphorobacter aerolatus]QNP48731.1 zinc ribbon domain-containing protein [Diaphorobacter aerolatus]